MQFDNDANQGLQLIFAPFFGTDYTGTLTLDQWNTYSSSARMPDNTSTWWTTNDSTWEITGMQLEVGSVATPFEHRNFSDDLRRCQRYYQEISMSTILMGSTNGSTQLGNVSIPLAVPMRSAPTIASGITYHMWHGDNNGANNDGTALVASSFSDSNNPSHSVLIKGTLNGFSGRTDNRIGGACANSGTPIKMDSEL